MCHVGGHRHGLVMMVVLFELDGRDQADLAVEPTEATGLASQRTRWFVLTAVTPGLLAHRR